LCTANSTKRDGITLCCPGTVRDKLYFIPAELPSKFQDIRILIEVWLRRDGFILEKMPAHPARNSPVERVLAPKFKE
jgi:hypothetical protein